MSRDTTSQTRPPPPADVLDEVYRRIVEVHYALAETGTPNEELHRWCIGRLMDLLEYLEGLKIDR